MNKHYLSGAPDDIRAQLEDLAGDQDPRAYLAGTWFRELAVRLASRGDFAVSAVSYDDPAMFELEVVLTGTHHRDVIVIDRSQCGEHCQITVERWLPISGEPGIEAAVSTIHSILAASARAEGAEATGATAEP